jgi:hypothetical protein
MTISKLTTLKKWAPILTISFASAAFASGRVNCANYFENAEIEFYHDDKGGEYIFLDHYKAKDLEIFGGSGTIAGKGVVGKSKLDVTLTFTKTGFKTSSNVGKLSGTKTSAGWDFVLIPWDAKTKSYKTTEKIDFKNCSEN